MMGSIRQAKEICKLQGIRFKLEVIVLCPGCNNKTLRLKLKDDKAKCSKCNKKYKSIEEVYKIEEANYIEDRHKHTDMKIRTNRGDI